MANGKHQKWLEPNGITLLQGWARDGLTNEQIAKNMGVGLSTLYSYQKRYSVIAEALKKGKEVADYEVENALYRRAIGCTVMEIVEIDGEKVKEITKTVPPDTAAVFIWLKNRRPDKWRDKVSTDDSKDAEKGDNLIETLNKKAQGVEWE